MMKNLTFAANDFIGSSTFLFPRLAPRFHRAIVTPETGLCIAGPPRSANTYATRVFKAWNPGVKVAHHNHTPMQVIYAVKWDVPCIIPLRQPLDTLASVMIVDQRLSMTLAIYSYINFYKRTLPVREKTVVVPFQRVITEFDQVVAEVNRKYGTSFNYRILSKDEDCAIQKKIKTGREKKKKDPLLVAVPTPEKEKKKVPVKDALKNHCLFPMACSVYEQWLDFAQRG